MKIRLIAGLLGWGIATSPSLSLAQQAGNGPPVPVIQPAPQAPIITISPYKATDYGLKCDGTTDDTAALNALITRVGAAGGGTIVFPAATCIFAGTIIVNEPAIHIIGQGTGATVLDFTGTGTADAFQLGTFPSSSNCVGSTQPSTCRQDYNLSVSNLSINAPNRTGGFVFDLNGVSQAVFSDIQSVSWDFLKTQYVNNIVLSRITGYTNDTTNFAVNLYQAITTGTSAGWYRSDVITFNDFTINAQGKGGSCINWDGMVQTIRMNRMGLLDCAVALAISNSQLSTSWFPEFLFATDLEIDGTTNQGVEINAGRDLNFVNSDIDTCAATTTGHYPIVTAPDSSYSVTSGIRIVGTEVHCAPGSAAYLNAQDITISGSQFFDTNHSGTGTSPDVAIAGNSKGVTITGSFLGQRWGDPDAPQYGVLVASGASNVALTGNNYQSATTGSVINQSTAAIGFAGGIGYNGAAITATSCAAATTC